MLPLPAGVVKERWHQQHNNFQTHPGQVQMQIIVADIKQGSNWLFLQEELVKWAQLYPTGSHAQWVFDNFLKSFELFIHWKLSSPFWEDTHSF